MTNRILKILWPAFLFTFPFSLHYVLYEPSSYRFGNFNPWVTGFLFLPEILLALIFLIWGIDQIRQKKMEEFKWPTPGLWLIKLLVLNAALVTLFRGDIFLFLFLAVRITEAYLIYVLIKNEIIPHQKTITWLLYGAAFQIALAYLQTRLNHSVGLQFIGEPIIGPDVMNVAKFDLPDGTKEIRPYGTFLHPNVLGGYLVAVLFMALPYLKKAALPFWIIVLTTGIFLTGSRAAELTIIVAFSILFVMHFLKKPRQKRWFSLGLITIMLVGHAWFFLNSARVNSNDPSITARLDQNVISLDMFLNNFWGVGVSNFTLEMERYGPEKLMPWEFQPVHNAYYLALNETGLQGFILLVLLIAYFLHTYWKDTHEYSLQDKARIMPALSLIIIASFDHLLLTSYLGLWLIGFVVAETTRAP